MLYALRPPVMLNASVAGRRREGAQRAWGVRRSAARNAGAAGRYSPDLPRRTTRVTPDRLRVLPGACPAADAPRARVARPCRRDLPVRSPAATAGALSRPDRRRGARARL